MIGITPAVLTFKGICVLCPPYTFLPTIDQFDYLEAADDEACVKEGVAAVREGKADLILKGKTATSTLMKGVLNKESGLNLGHMISDVFIYETSERLIDLDV